MSVSGNMAISKETFKSGRSSINTQRGTNTWGANYLYNVNGAQEDLLVMSDVANEARASGFGFSSSGVADIGSADAPLVSSGLYMNAVDGTPMQLVIYANGLVSGVVA